MNILRHAVLLAASAVALAACAPGAPDTAADEAEIKADPGEWMAAYNSGDADAVASLYTDDALLLAPGAPAQQGTTAIRDFIAAEIAKAKAAGLTFKAMDTTGVGVSGDMGWVSGTFAVTDSSGSAVDKGKFLSVYRRTNGNWQLLRDTWNSDLAPPAAPAPAAEAAPPAN